jgi:hypothetical protein
VPIRRFTFLSRNAALCFSGFFAIFDGIAGTFSRISATFSMDRTNEKRTEDGI